MLLACNVRDKTFVFVVIILGIVAVLLSCELIRKASVEERLLYKCYNYNLAICEVDEIRFSSGKVSGVNIKGDKVSYDIDVRLFNSIYDFILRKNKFEMSYLDDNIESES